MHQEHAAPRTSVIYGAIALECCIALRTHLYLLPLMPRIMQRKKERGVHTVTAHYDVISAISNRTHVILSKLLVWSVIVISEGFLIGPVGIMQLQGV